MPELTATLLSAFPGSFHPMLVHLPIGILCFAAVLDAWCRIRNRPGFHQSLVLMYAAGACCAWLSVLTGWVLADSGDYAGDLLFRHRWMGVTTAAYSSLYAWRMAARRSVKFTDEPHHEKGKSAWMIVLPLGLLTTILLTGHWGGSLTHGEGYLLKDVPLFGSAEESQESLTYQIADPAKALAYQDITAVMLTQKCVSCHGPQKQKGKLRLDRPDFLFLGGKHGEVVLPGKPEESELLRRLLLPINDEEHMPPKEKPQLSREEIAYLHWWISGGADTTRTLFALAAPDSVQELLRILQHKDKKTTATRDQLPEPSGEPSAATLDSLEKRGLLLMPLSRESRNLEVSFLNIRDSADALLRLLEPLAPFIVHLDLAGKACSDKGLSSIGRLTRLRTLNLARTKISDKGMPAISGLTDLEKLNLSGTAVTAEGLQSLGKLQRLQAIYLYQSGIPASAIADLQILFPGARIDTGGYRLPAPDSARR